MMKKIDIQANLNDEQPLSMRDGGIIREGIEKGKLDELRKAAAIGHKWFKDLEEGKSEVRDTIPKGQV